MKNHNFIIIFDENLIIFDGYRGILHHFAVSITTLEDFDEINGHPGKANQHLGVSVGKNCFVNV